jgi:hypothetical protein
VSGGYPSVWIVEASRGAGAISIPDELQQEAEKHYIAYVRSGH